MSQGYCTDHSFWDVQDGYLCAGLPPSKSTPMKGWKHVTTGGKGTCQGDFGAPLICDIDGRAIIIGIYSEGSLEQCGLDGRPAVHLNLKDVLSWISHTTEQNAPPKTCFKLVTDSSVANSLGNEIRLFKNGVDIGIALHENSLSNKICVDDSQDGDVFKFINGGKDNVSKRNIICKFEISHQSSLYNKECVTTDAAYYFSERLLRHSFLQIISLRF